MRLVSRAFCAALLILAASLNLKSGEPKLAREEGEFKIMMNGIDIGREKYVILSSDTASSSSSVLDFRNPGDKNQRVQMETRLEMGERYLPKDYQLKSNVAGQKGAIHGEFNSHQVIFEYTAGDAPRKSGLLLGDEFTVLDTNIFHHFVFLARLFKYGDRKSAQRFEVVVPQEQDNGEIAIRELGKEEISVLGKKTIETHHLQLDSGALQIHLWVDKQRILYKISVPEKGIEVLRVSYVVRVGP
jgi:hypothetical protein